MFAQRKCFYVNTPLAYIAWVQFPKFPYHPPHSNNRKFNGSVCILAENWDTCLILIKSYVPLLIKELLQIYVLLLIETN